MLLSVCLSLSQLFTLSAIQYMGLCVFSSPSPHMIIFENVFFILLS